MQAGEIRSGSGETAAGGYFDQNAAACDPTASPATPAVPLVAFTKPRDTLQKISWNITRLLGEWRQGSRAALDALLPLVYDELRRIASRQMARERDGHTLQATALVNEAWIQLAHAAKIELKDRAHFLAIAARVMRQILVQYARGHNNEKRGVDRSDGRRPRQWPRSGRLRPAGARPGDGQTGRRG